MGTKKPDHSAPPGPSAGGAARAKRMGLLIPEFPTQTHIAMWRLGQGIAARGVDVQMLSTRAPSDSRARHPELVAAAEQTFYAWPASIGTLVSEALRCLHRLPRALVYALTLGESSWSERVRAFAFILPALSLKAGSRRMGLDYIFVHSCAGAAHVLAMCRLLGGPRYSLRLGGQPSVYGKDHAAKMAHAEFIVAAANVNKQQAHEVSGLPDERVIWSWLGLGTERFASASRRGGELRDPRMVTVARLNHAKGHRFAIEAVAQLASEGLDPLYTLVGDGPARGEIEELAKRLGVEDRVVFVGECDQDEILVRLREADVFVLPTSGPGEGSPMAVVEAMAAGLPILASDVGGLRDMVEPGTHGQLLPPGDAEAIADAVRELARDGDSRVAMGCASAERARAEFDVSAVAARLDRLFFGESRDRDLR